MDIVTSRAPGRSYAAGPARTSAELESVIAEEMLRLSERALRTLDAAEREQLVRFLGEIRRNVS
ncbi:hypothetical protein GCM10022226_24990 [Sphaerisporangium flaviroseum]|uniref:MarR family transcriptional regulator n=1 Tax=Sphaerisporangium flaviroseum TaxID=509199 RepID=A0ABP7HW66_9ACTN